jgi:hypothetical protein
LTWSAFTINDKSSNGGGFAFSLMERKDSSPAGDYRKSHVEGASILIVRSALYSSAGEHRGEPKCMASVSDAKRIASTAATATRIEEETQP